MNPLSFPLLADENIHVDVIQSLVDQGKDVRSVHDVGLTGAQDIELLRRAHELGRVILTHDSDFGKLAVCRLWRREAHRDHLPSARPPRHRVRHGYPRRDRVTWR